MTNKQIIKNGIDVSGCEYYFDEKCRCMDASIMQDFYSCPQCNSNPNCYYKQLKRKEQECEELKEKYLNLKEQNGSSIVQLNTTNEQLDQLKAENWNLKRELMQYEKDVKELNHFAMKLKQTLTEIKEIAEESMRAGRMLSGGWLSQKISEAEESKLKHCFSDDCERYKKVLEEIKPILELYANSKIGEEQPDGTYKIVGKAIGVMGGACIVYYDPRPAREGLKKISEVEDEQ